MSRFAPQTLDQWVEELSDMKAVSLGAVIQELNRLTASDETSLNELADAIMKDPGLTGKVLKAANSVAFNPQEIPVTTISRAIMHVGFDTVRALCVGALLAEQLLGPEASDQLVTRIAHAITAATQARKLCRGFRSQLREEVFVATLLYHLGELLVWSYPHPVVDRASRMLIEQNDVRAAEKVLGVRFAELSRTLAERWRLGQILEEALGQPASKAARAVRLGEDIARALPQGLDSPAMKACITEACKVLGLDERTVTEGIREGIQEAESLGRSYGDARLNAVLGQQTRSHMTPKTGQGKLLEPDSSLQLKILQDIMQAMSTGMTSTELFRHVLDGLHRGVGLERICLALLNPQRTQLAARIVVGEGTETWKTRFVFPYERQRGSFWYDIMQTPGIVWLGHPDHVRLEGAVPPALRALIGPGQGLMGPLVTQGREIGLLYADLRSSGRPLNQAYAGGFRYFVQQANLCLNLMAQRASRA
ncbi:HDOD domain-containing protein [Hahella sp. SMD15-11]|uniref:HDOD domain-containing protein n=1 Tax=Thermohahella caldifontis TaxID=3142973 RepID=A0AB39UX68_9GAMM